MDEPRGRDLGGAARVFEPGVHRQRPSCSAGERAGDHRASVPSGGVPHAEWGGHPQELPLRGLRLQRNVDACQLHNRGHRQDSGPGGRRQGDLCVVGGSGLGGDGGAGAEGNRGPADVYLRGQRAVEEGGVGEGEGGLRTAPEPEPDIRRRGGQIPGETRRGYRPGEEDGTSSGRSSSGCSRRRRES